MNDIANLEATAPALAMMCSACWGSVTGPTASVTKEAWSVEEKSD